MMYSLVMINSVLSIAMLMVSSSRYLIGISHILVDCIEYDFFRLILFDKNFTLTDILNNVSPNKIISLNWIVQHFVTHLLYCLIYIYILFTVTCE